MARPKSHITIYDRIHSNLRLADSGCHEFTGHRNDDGYGRIHNGPKLGYAHRVKWELYNGEIPKGMRILHKCDNPCCVNIEHLFIGTQLDNMRDRANKGRYDHVGSKNNSAVINEKDVLIIKERISLGHTSYGIAREYGVTGEAILAIKHGRTWKHVA